MKIINKFNTLKKQKPLTFPILALFIISVLGCAHTVKINTTPPGALVVVDGKKVGVALISFNEGIDIMEMTSASAAT